jgi:hypothetical protein
LFALRSISSPVCLLWQVYHPPFVCSEKYSIPRLFVLSSIDLGDDILLRGYKRGMLFFSEQANGGCYTSQSKQTGDAILLRANQRMMLSFSEQTNGGCYASQNKQTGVAILLRASKQGMLLFSEHIGPLL